MRIALIGYGKMGRAIEVAALKRGHEIIGKADNEASLKNLPEGIEVAIEFSQPDAVVHNLTFCFENDIPVVCGTTGWLDQKQEVEKKCFQTNGSFFYASNYSLGVNIFFKLNAYLAKIMESFQGYEVAIDETHHTQKKDSPSGTAITLAEGIVKNNKNWDSWTQIHNHDPKSFVISSFRVDPFPGTHVVKYNSMIDNIEIVHTAHSRDGFAQGAVLVAEWLRGKRGIFSMDDFLKF